MTTEKGGIIDDTIITCKDGFVFMVINAGCIEKDLKHMRAQLEIFNKENNADVSIEQLDRSLLALQGIARMGCVGGCKCGDLFVCSALHA